MLHQNKLKLYNKYKKNNYWKTSKFTNFDLNKKYYSLYNLRLVSLSTFYKKKLTTKQCLKDYLTKFNINSSQPLVCTFIYLLYFFAHCKKYSNTFI